jgi:hypothetical protein
MAEIQEIPLDAVEAPEAVPEVEERAARAQSAHNQEVEAPAPKKRGRPPGVKNKAKAPPAPKAKPKAKRKAYVPPSPAESSSGEDTPPPRARRPARHTPEPLDRRALAADVLGLLQEQRMSRGIARRTHYASWFQNM